MTSPKRDSELVQAAKALDAELTAFAAAAEEIRRAPLASQRHLEKAAQLLAQIGEAETALRARITTLAQALQAANAAREAQGASILVRAGQVEARHHDLQRLMAMYAALGVKASEVNSHLAPIAGEADDARRVRAEAHLAALADEVQALFEAAREADYHDVMRMADALRQQLGSLRAKLRKGP